MSREFIPWWAAHFGAVPPLGYELREAFASRWLRTHSLPGSNRYAESADEHEEVLRRYVALAQEVLDVDSTPWVLTISWDDERESLTIPELACAPLLRVHSLPPIDDGLTPVVGTVWVGRAVPTDDALRAIASDQLRALWVSESSCEVFAPYDGGCDLIVRSPERVAELRGKFRAWLSDRQDGL